MNRAQTGTVSLLRSLNREYLVLSFVPLLAFSICTVTGAFLAQSHIAGLIDGSMRQLEAEIETRTVRDGEKIIHSRAREVARQLELVIGSQPGTTIEQLQQSPTVNRIAVQRVGRTGYTCLYEAGTGIMRMHPNSDLIDFNMRALAEKLPSWWATFEPSLSGNEVSGYYDWLEEDGRITQKYMTMMPIGLRIGGRTMMVAATTYMDEFLSAVRFTRERGRDIVGDYGAYVSHQSQIIGAGMLLILTATLFVVAWLSRRAATRFTLPIRQLAEIAASFGREMKIENRPTELIGRSDEIGELARSFISMRSQITDQFKRIQAAYEKLSETQQALYESEMHYRSLFENLPIGICRSDAEGRIIDANPALVAMYGHPNRESLLARPATDLYVNPQDRERFKAMVEGHSNGGSCELHMRRRDGSRFWVEIQAVADRDDAGRIRYYESSSMDITERKKAEENLQLARFCIENAAMGIFRVADDARILEVNEHACRSLGYNREELLGMTIFDIDPTFSREKWTVHRRKLAEERVRVVQSQHRRKDGSLIPVEVAANYIQKDEYGFSYSFVTEISARLEREKLEAQLQQAQKMEAIGTLAGGIAHDFNNILSVIIGNANILEISDSMTAADLLYVNQILTAADRARQLVQQILTFSRRGEQQRLLVNLKPVVKETYHFLKATLPSSIDVRQSIHADAGTILADPTQMQQVLMNLCTNAAHAMDRLESGVLKIGLEKAVLAEEDLRFQPEIEAGEYVKLTVTDSGMGIDPFVRERIFEPYFTTKELGKGTGLGLSVVHGIVQSHGGFIKVYSEPGHGTSFQVYFPVALEGRQTAPAAAGKRLPTGSETVLVVDDEKFLIDMTQQMLERLGYRVETRTSPLEAIEAFSANPGRYDALITDMTMPQMNGLSLAKRLLEIRPDLPILLCTGFSDQANEEKARAAGIREFAFKPLALNDLANTLRKMLDDALSATMTGGKSG
jgi:two-component system cell cycle sensor histidine kinase/response regulator CckA